MHGDLAARLVNPVLVPQRTVERDSVIARRFPFTYRDTGRKTYEYQETRVATRRDSPRCKINTNRRAPRLVAAPPSRRAKQTMTRISFHTR
jgi:hypothetical protein